MGKKQLNSSPRVVGDQALGVDSSGLLCGSPASASRGLDVLLLRDLPEKMSYRAIHDLVKPHGDVVRIRLIYNTDCQGNRCYVTFASAEQAKLAFDAVGSFGLSDLRPEVLSSVNVAESEHDYVPNVFERAAEEASQGVRPVPTPRWFLAYYRGGRGNFIHASRFVDKEFGIVPRENIRKYGKGLLIKAKDLTQAKMLLNFHCNAECMFDAIRPHRTFNYSRGIVYNYDLAEFSEEEICAICPPTVQKVWKVKGKGNMIVLTFFGSTLPDYVHIGPLTLRVKPFLDRPLQCYGCYEFGHSKKHCTVSPRCARCSALGAHGGEDCDAGPYCFHCRADHQLRSRDCPRYRLEQDVLQLANTNFISLGSARRELSYRQNRSGEATSYSASLGYRLRPSRTQPSSVTSGTPVRNKFSVLEVPGDGVSGLPEASPSSAETSPAPEAQAPRSPRRRDPKLAAGKRVLSPTGSVELLTLPPSKISTCRPSCVLSGDGSVSKSTVSSVTSSVRPSSLSSASVAVDTDASHVGQSFEVADVDPSEDMQLVDEDLCTELVHHMSQESLSSVSQDPTQVGPGIAASHSGGVGCVNGANSGTKPKLSFSAVVNTPVDSTGVLRSDSLSRPTISSVGDGKVSRPGSRPLNPIRSDPLGFSVFTGQGSGITHEHTSTDERNSDERHSRRNVNKLPYAIQRKVPTTLQ